MVPPITEPAPIKEALSSLRIALGELNGSRSRLETTGSNQFHQSIEHAVDQILALADAQSTDSPAQAETFVIAQAANPTTSSLGEKLDRIAQLLESDHSLSNLSKAILEDKTHESLQAVKQLRSELDSLNNMQPAKESPSDSPLNRALAPTIIPEDVLPAPEPTGEKTIIFAKESVSTKPSEGIAPPTIFEEAYAITGSVGEGGMGTVLRVHNKKLGRDEAAKKIQPKPGESASDQEQKLKRFREEVRISAQLAPAGFVQTYDIFVTKDKKVGFTMELIEGGINLERLIAAYKTVLFDDHLQPNIRQPGRAALEATVLGNQISETDTEAFGITEIGVANQTEARELLARVLRISPASERPTNTERKALTKALVDKLIDVCQNLQIMHDLGFIHRDIKPANLLIDPQGRVRLADAGLAEEITNLPFKNPGISGTPQYMSPEQVVGMPAYEGVHTDVYGVGAILYEIICGKTQIVIPAGQGISLARLASIKDGEIPAPVRPGFGMFTFHDLEAICKKAMAKDPSDRYQSVAALADELTAWVRGGEVPAYAHSAPAGIRQLYGFRSYIADHPFKALGFSGGTFATIAGGIFGFSAWGARSEFDRLTHEAEAAYKANDTDALARSLEFHRRADTVLAPFDRTFEFFGSAAPERNEQIRTALEQEISARREALEIFNSFSSNVSSALRAASSDFSTYYATDRTARLIEQSMAAHVPDLFDPHAAEKLVSFLHTLSLQPEEEREFLSLAAQAFESRAFKLPFHPDLGLKFRQDADRGQILLKNARLLYQEIGLPLSTSEALLELRLERDRLRVAEGRRSFSAKTSQDQLSNTAVAEQAAKRISNIETLLKELQPTSARDFYSLGRIAFFDRADDASALKHFQKAIELAESVGLDDRSNLAPSLLFGALYGKGLTLMRLGQHEEANSAFSEARRTIQNLNLDQEQDNDLFALCTSKIAHSYTMSFMAKVGGSTRNLTPEQLETVTALYDQANRVSPNNVAVLNAYATFCLDRGDYEKSEVVFTTLLAGHPEYDYGFAQRAYVRSKLGKTDLALNDLMIASGLNPAGVPPTDLFSRLEDHLSNNPEVLADEGNLDKVWRFTTAIAECGNHVYRARGEQEAERYLQLSLQLLDVSVTWVENRNGYGKDLVRPTELFRRLLEKHPQEFTNHFQRLSRFDSATPFRSSY